MLDDNFELPKLKTDVPSNPESENKNLDDQVLIDVAPNLEEDNLTELPSLKETKDSDLNIPELAEKTKEEPLIEIAPTELEVPMVIETISETPAPLELPVVELENPAPVELVNLEEDSFEEFIPVEPTVQSVVPNNVVEINEPSVSLEEETSEITIEPVWADKPIKQKRKDPVVIIFTFLIIAAIIAAAVYFFMSQGFDIPFLNNNNSNTQNNSKNNTNPLGLYGIYESESGLICPGEVSTLELNNDATFVFSDLVFDGDYCEIFTLEGTFTRDENYISLIIDEDDIIEVIFSSSASKAEIRIPINDEEYLIVSRHN